MSPLFILNPTHFGGWCNCHQGNYWLGNANGLSLLYLSTSSSGSCWYLWPCSPLSGFCSSPSALLCAFSPRNLLKCWLLLPRLLSPDRCLPDQQAWLSWMHPSFGFLPLCPMALSLFLPVFWTSSPKCVTSTIKCFWLKLIIWPWTYPLPLVFSLWVNYVIWYPIIWVRILKCHLEMHSFSCSFHLNQPVHYILWFLLPEIFAPCFTVATT